MTRVRLALAGLALAVAAACGSAEGPPPAEREGPRGPLPPVTQPDLSARSGHTIALHTVAPGETLWRISRQYGTTVDAIMAENGITDVRTVATGARLRVPTSSATADSRRDDARTYASRDPRGTVGGSPHFGWPVEGEIISRFGYRHGQHHDGIDIRAPKGTRVYAAEAGRVIHADATLEGYGKMIVIKHTGHLYSVYAHNSKLLVHPGEFVEKGQAIAEVGQSGNATTPHLHFEIRTDQTPHDPLGYLE